MNSVNSEFINQVYAGFYYHRLSKKGFFDGGIKKEEFLRFFDNSIQADQMEKNAIKILSPTKRYQFHAITNRAKLLKSIFNQSYLYCPEKVIAAAEKMDRAKAPFYSPLRKVYAIDFPRIVGNLIDYKYIKVALAISSFVLFVFKLEEFYDSTQFFFTAKIIPLMINTFPIQAIQSMNLTVTITEAVFDLIITVQENFIEILIISYIARMIIIKLQIPYISKNVEEFNSSWILNVFLIAPQTTGEFLVRSASDGARFIYRQFGDIGKFFKRIANQAEKERQCIAHRKAFEVWRTIIHQEIPEKVFAFN